jgi:hypothetical protein
VGYLDAFSGCGPCHNPIVTAQPLLTRWLPVASTGAGWANGVIQAPNESMRVANYPAFLVEISVA